METLDTKFAVFFFKTLAGLVLVLEKGLCKNYYFGESSCLVVVGTSLVAELVENLPAMWETWV